MLHSVESKELIAQHAAKSKSSVNGYVKTKHFKIFCEELKREVDVQGTWELKYAEFLNDMKVRWVKTREKFLSYKFHENDYVHHYYPDFYLIDSDEFIEIKGYFWKNDELKMKRVQECNPNVKIKILRKEHLENLGIKL